uniref:mRNA export factor GLE1 n=1 Tax=Anolis carolinensis TaxID=28377 RepID=L7MZS8_ANOCA|nr:PREDICTED: nucleoporin GLE1 isoform X2 [Anolis carolinensis]|eukprot:XP_016854266.1 PREDICTED: nucleoporin GLE1 isoform X2 [Anolis carolinensis]
MPSRELQMKTVAALRRSRKGRLPYRRDWSPQAQEILEQHNRPPELSAYSGWVLEKMLSCSPKPRPVLVSPDNESALIHGLSSLTIDASPDKHLVSTPLSTDAPSEAQDPKKWRVPESAHETNAHPRRSKSTEIDGLIRWHEEIQQLKVKEELNQRLELQEEVVKAASEEARELLKRFDELKELKRHQECQQLQQEIEKSNKEALGQQEKLKEEHRQRAKMVSRKLREAEQQRQRQEELDRLRREEGQERLRRLYSIQEEVLRLNQQIGLNHKHKDLPGIDLSLYSNRGNQICGEVSGIVRTASERGLPTETDVASADQVLLEMHQLISNMQHEVALALEKKRRQEEELAAAAVAAANERKEELKKQEQAKSQVPDQGLRVKAEEVTMQWYQQLQKESAQCVAAFGRLASSKDSQDKKIKMDLQKAATIPVSQISTRAGSQLKEIFEKIHSLLSGKPVPCGGHNVSVTQHPEGLEFVYFKLAEKFVKQGEEEVASHHEAAFPIAVVASGIWELHPRVGGLILAHLHKKCPYAVPFYPALKEGTSLEEYQRILGYQVKDSNVEPQDNFLKRMSGMIRLYAAILQMQWPYRDRQGVHPHGLNHAWRWLAQMLNMEPLADVTATILFDFLEVSNGSFFILSHSFLLHDGFLPQVKKTGLFKKLSLSNSAPKSPCSGAAIMALLRFIGLVGFGPSAFLSVQSHFGFLSCPLE